MYNYQCSYCFKALIQDYFRFSAHSGMERVRLCRFKTQNGHKSKSRNESCFFKFNIVGS